MKDKLKKIWLGRFIKKIFFNKPIKKIFPGSKQYWEQRYQSNKNSGSGSYGRLALFKAEIINAFVEARNINTIIEFGCGDGNQLDIADYPNYVGYDVSNKAIDICKEKFKNDNNKCFYILSDSLKIKAADLALSLDVTYHLIEDEIFDIYMKQLFSSSLKYVIIYSSNYNDHFAPHVKCRKFTDWIEEKVLHEWKQIKYIKNKYPFDEKEPDNTSMADFYIYKKIN